MKLTYAEVHAITAPTQRKLLKRVRELTEGRSVLAVNFDYNVGEDEPETAIVVFE